MVLIYIKLKHPITHPIPQMHSLPFNYIPATIPVHENIFRLSRKESEHCNNHLTLHYSYCHATVT